MHEQRNPFMRHLQCSIRHPVVARQFVGLSGESTHHADSTQIFFHHLGQYRQLVLQFHPRVAQFQSGDRGAYPHDRHEAQCQQAEHEINPEQDDGATEDQDAQ